MLAGNGVIHRNNQKRPASIVSRRYTP
jgi:hypothetical protein